MAQDLTTEDTENTEERTVLLAQQETITDLILKNRGLEHERDEAREERDIARLEVEEITRDLAGARKQIEGLNNFANERFDEIQKVRKERDEAVETWRTMAARLALACIADGGDFREEALRDYRKMIEEGAK